MADELKMVQLNIVAPLHLTKLFGRAMVLSAGPVGS
jgi:short-subunit dehydrogenase